jgi:type II secretory pathway component PulJ
VQQQRAKQLAAQQAALAQQQAALQQEMQQQAALQAVQQAMLAAHAHVATCHLVPAPAAATLGAGLPADDQQPSSSDLETESDTWVAATLAGSGRLSWCLCTAHAQPAAF